VQLRESLIKFAPNLVFGLVGLAALSLIGSLPYMVEFGPGPGFFPFWIGLGLAVLGIGSAALGVFQDVRSPAARSLRPEVEPATSDRPDSYKNLMAYAGVVVAALLFQRVGAAESLGLLVLYLTAGVERRPLRQALTAALLTMLFLWLVFFRLLQLRLPGLIFK